MSAKLRRYLYVGRVKIVFIQNALIASNLVSLITLNIYVCIKGSLVGLYGVNWSCKSNEIRIANWTLSTCLAFLEFNNLLSYQALNSVDCNLEKF